MSGTVAAERTGWRDERLSNRHRKWGWNCPCVDLDFLVIEYNRGSPVALVEYKHERAAPQNLQHPTYQAIIQLANGYDKGPLPFILAIYAYDPWMFYVLPVNDAARCCYGHCERQWISEQRFVRGLYYLRKKSLTTEDEEAINKLDDVCEREPSD